MKITYRALLEQQEDQALQVPELDAATQARIRDRVLEQIGQKPPARRRHRRLRPVLIAVAAVFVLSITAGAAYYVSHDSTKALFSQDPQNGGIYPVEVDDRSASVIDQVARDYDITTGGVDEMVSEAQTTAVTETQITLNNIMGFHSPYFSVAYVTVTVDLPEDQRAGVDPETCGFHHAEIQAADSDECFAYDGSWTAVQNTDGTVSIMLCQLYRYQDVNNIPATLTLETFYTGSEQLAGTWTFDLGALELDDLTSVDFCPEDFADTGITPSDIQLSAFGGTLTMEGYLELMDSKFRTMVRERYGDLELDWDQVSALDRTYLQGLYEDGTLTLEQLENIYCIADGNIEYFGRENVAAFQVALEYADGTVCEADTQLGTYPMSLLLRQTGLLTASGSGETADETERWISEDQELLPFLFDAPQDLTQAKYLIIEGVKIPLNT